MLSFARSLAETDKYPEAITLSLNAAAAASAMSQAELVGEAMICCRLAAVTLNRLSASISPAVPLQQLICVADR